MKVVYNLSKSLYIAYYFYSPIQFISVYTNTHFYNKNRFLLDSICIDKF